MRLALLLPSAVSSPGANAPDASALAFALKLLEARSYFNISQADCVSWMLDPEAPNALSEACAVNNKIVNWVRRSVLSGRDDTRRSQYLLFFIETAQVRTFLDSFV